MTEPHDKIAAFEQFANGLLKQPGGQQQLIAHIERNGAPVDSVELLETLRAPRGDVLGLVLLPLPDGSFYMMAVRRPSGGGGKL